MPQPARLALKSHRYLAPLLEPTPVREVLKWLAGLVREGPASWSRKRGSAYVWGEARVEGDGESGDEAEGGEPDERVVSRLQTPDAYVVTVDAALAATERILEGDADPGFQTPAGAFGSEFVLELEGVEGFFDESKPESEPPEVDVSAP